MQYKAVTTIYWIFGNSYPLINIKLLNINTKGMKGKNTSKKCFNLVKLSLAWQIDCTLMRSIDILISILVQNLTRQWTHNFGSDQSIYILLNVKKNLLEDIGGSQKVHFNYLGMVCLDLTYSGWPHHLYASFIKIFSLSFIQFH